MKKNTCTIYVVRHGESEANVLANNGTLFKSSFEESTPLSKNGIMQTELLAHKFRDIPFSAIYSSEYARAKETAEILKGNRDLELITEASICERNYGHWAGKWHSIKNKIQEEIQHLPEEEKMKFVFEDVETEENMVNRFSKFIKSIALSNLNKTILVISHGNIMRSFLVTLGFCTYHQLPPSSIPNNAYFIIESDGENFQIKDTCRINNLL